MAKQPKQARRKALFYGVVFGNEEGATIALQGNVVASSPARACYLAVREARRKAGRFDWRSIEVCIDRKAPNVT